MCTGLGIRTRLAGLWCCMTVCVRLLAHFLKGLDSPRIFRWFAIHISRTNCSKCGRVSFSMPNCKLQTDCQFSWKNDRQVQRQNCKSARGCHMRAHAVREQVNPLRETSCENNGGLGCRAYCRDKYDFFHESCYQLSRGLLAPMHLFIVISLCSTRYSSVTLRVRPKPQPQTEP